MKTHLLLGIAPILLSMAELQAESPTGKESIHLEYRTASPDGRLFAGYYRDGWDEVISIHEAASGKQVARIIGHGDDVRELRFSPDGKFLASRCVNRSRRGWALWNVATGELVLRLPTTGSKDSSESSPAALWLKLSVRAQNAAFEFQRLSQMGDPDFSRLDDDRESISELLDKLVKEKVLVDETLTLLSREELGVDGFQNVTDYVDTLSKDYGYYVALEMMDLGIGKKLDGTEKQREPIHLRLRLPAKRMSEFRALAERNRIIRE